MLMVWAYLPMSLQAYHRRWHHLYIIWSASIFTFTLFSFSSCCHSTCFTKIASPWNSSLYNARMLTWCVLPIFSDLRVVHRECCCATWAILFGSWHLEASCLCCSSKTAFQHPLLSAIVFFISSRVRRLSIPVNSHPWNTTRASTSVPLTNERCFICMSLMACLFAILNCLMSSLE